MDTSNTQPGNDAADTATGEETEVRTLTGEEASDLDKGRHSAKTNKILDDAEQRHDQTSARDKVSDERARVADRDAFTSTEGTYTGHKERRAAAGDRADSKRDRESSADDRAQLTEETRAAESDT
jgi:hypothetical protein